MIGYLDCSTGVSGDKLLGALLAVGTTTGAFTTQHLQELVSDIAPEALVVVEPRDSYGISGTGVTVRALGEPHSRTWGNVRDLLEAAELPERVLTRALAAFEALAVAEAQVHGTDPEKVHFHEVGGLDSIMDVLGVCAGLEALGIESLLATTVATGSGTVQTSHGLLPVPAPATAALLIDVPTEPGPSPSELTTPTGAALLRVCADGFGVAPPMVPRLIGYGVGTRDIGCANVCRLIIGTVDVPDIRLHGETVTLLETNIDHISPEAAAFAAEQLLAEGALDVWTSPIVMKKGRSAFTLSALCGADYSGHFAERVVSLTGSLGVRTREIERYAASRDVRVIETAYGTVRFKTGAGRARPEADDVARIARESGRSFEQVEQELSSLLDGT